MAFEGLREAWSDERTSYRDEAFYIVDKPAGVACEGATPASTTAQYSLPDRLFEHGLGRVRVVWGVPDRASGATLVARGDDAAVSVGAGWPTPLDALTCIVAVDNWSLRPNGSLQLGGATLEYRVDRRQGARALVELRGPVSADQVLGTLREQGQPIVGDVASSAAPATRLMLHVTRLQGRVSGAAPLPAAFESWLSGKATLPPERFASALGEAAASRHGLWSEVGAFRLLGEDAGEIAGVTVERYGDHAVLYLSSDEAARRELEMADCLMDHGAEGVYVKRRVRADLRGVDPASLAPPLPLRGSPAPEWLELRQGPFKAGVCLGEGLATGLFLDQRANWGRVLGWAKGATFLNLFSYTGAFTLAAAAGGAASTTSVDLAGRALSRLGKNLELNAWSGPSHRLLKADVPAWLARARRARHCFDAIVLDPPSFGTRARGVLSTRRDNPELVEAALGVLAPRGRLLCVSHHRKIEGRELCEQVQSACDRHGRQARVELLVGGWDCPTLPGVSGTKSVLAQLV